MTTVQTQLLNGGALVILLAFATANIYHPWGLLYIYWAALSLRTGQAFLMSAVSKATNPLLFWGITLAWFGFGVLTLVYGG